MTSKRGTNKGVPCVLQTSSVTDVRRPLCVNRVHTRIGLISVIPHKIRYVIKNLRSDDLRAQNFAATSFVSLLY